MKQQIGGYKLDLLTSDEVRGHLEWLVDREQAERYRAITYLQFTESSLNGVPAVMFPGPESGYAWSVKLIGVQLSAVAPVSVYLGDNTATAPVASQLPIAGVGASAEVTFAWTSNVLVMTDNRNVTIACSEAVITSARFHVKQITAERVAVL